MEMKAACCGAIMYDEWALTGVHYVGLFASYNQKIIFLINGKGSIELEATISLITCALMAAIYDSDDSDEQEAADDAAKFQCKHFFTVFHSDVSIL